MPIVVGTFRVSYFIFALASASSFHATPNCAPIVHHDHTQLCNHQILHAQVLGDMLSINGNLSLYAFTDYGVKLIACRDNTGQVLRLRSAQIFWMKAECFELELDPPSAEARDVFIHLVFTTRAGVQEIKKTLTIDRSGRTSYLNQSRRWESGPEAE